MNIIIFCAYFHPHEGGVEKYVQNLFFDIKDVNVTIITSNSENVKPFEQKFGMNIYRFKCWHLMNKTNPIIKPYEYKKINKILLDKKFDYVITQTRFFNTSLIGCYLAKKHNIPLIHFEHGTKHSPIKNPVLNKLGEVYDHTIGRYIIKNSSICVGISNASCEFIKHLYSKTKKVECIYNSVDTSKFVKTSLLEQKKLKKKLGIRNEKVILFVGRIIFAKGVQDLLVATSSMRNIKVLIIGNGNYLTELKTTYPNAIYLGQRNEKEIISYLSISDIFVNPSYAEGLPTSILEAGALGISIIATDVGGTKEIIENGVTGELINAKDIDTLKNKINKVLKDPKLRHKYAKNVKKKIEENFDWEKNKLKLKKIL